MVLYISSWPSKIGTISSGVILSLFCLCIWIFHLGTETIIFVKMNQFQTSPRRPRSGSGCLGSGWSYLAPGRWPWPWPRSTSQFYLTDNAFFNESNSFVFRHYVPFFTKKMSRVLWAECFSKVCLKSVSRDIYLPFPYTWFILYFYNSNKTKTDSFKLNADQCWSMPTS